jgi:hypothetical protein
MSTVAPPAKKPAPPPSPKGPPPASGPAPVNTSKFSVSSGIGTGPLKAVVYGPGGVGKSELCSLLKDVGIRPRFLDIEEGSSYLDVDRITGIETWDDLRCVLHTQSFWQGYDAVVIDSLTKAEELAVAWTLENVLKEVQGGSPVRVKSIEGYGWGKGYVHVFETFLQLLGDLDAHVRAGRHVVCVAHDCTARVPNPAGEDWIRYEPRLQSADKGNIRAKAKEWSDHMLYIGFDQYVTEDGKAKGSGTRTIYTSELPTWMAKSRCLSEPVVYEKGDATIWQQLLAKRG